jgi:hypothetical protein
MCNKHCWLRFYNTMQKEKNSIAQIGMILVAAGVAVLLAHLLIRFAWPVIVIGGILLIIGYAMPGRKR